MAAYPGDTQTGVVLLPPPVSDKQTDLRGMPTHSRSGLLFMVRRLSAFFGSRSGGRRVDAMLGLCLVIVGFDSSAGFRQGGKQ